ncbi:MULTISPECIES: hypothetical protein [unclassified Thermosynechococcus]|uniref:hypothetical protein n=1 Tax=unclassified Thermosynechococcus TaxID=2622553 RepID=UPI002872FFB3|nr:MULTISPECIES: hypothetical protein [unclassified Thermosynechococcus]WNC31959.1 hypothetical protein RHH81_09990 [Thermosynechococcus sp. PKX95]WNC34488.1 hypothetical protein RHH79_09990 [Thermosynechococcus sp. PKX91]WNC37006.1 hypothetical protein RHI11_09980 [Thermosynechococcus sp. WL11]WNC39527.1 hypothetical protein RHI18_09980 [Thermosynechococcus sp. WL17]WNC42048.1 hypothetical protein RHI14_09970 [Thermosynechococcus sp. WL15]
MVHLSISQIYYLRHLLRQYAPMLKPVIAEGAAQVATAEADLGAVLESLYPEAEELATATEQLSRLLLLHQKKNLLSSEQYEAIVQQIFWILGLKYTSPEVGQQLDIA